MIRTSLRVANRYASIAGKRYLMAATSTGMTDHWWPLTTTATENSRNIHSKASPLANNDDDDDVTRTMTDDMMKNVKDTKRNHVAEYFQEDDVQKIDDYSTTTGHRLNHLDDLLDKTIELEVSLKEFQGKVSAKRRQLYYETEWSSSEEERMRILLSSQNDTEADETEKMELIDQLHTLESILEDDSSSSPITPAETKDNGDDEISSFTFAVDGPDGTSDGQMKNNMKEVDSIIDYAAQNENIEEIRQRHAVEDAIDASSAFAVDGPDGTPDGQMQNNIQGVDSMIQFAAMHENADKVRQRHAIEDAIDASSEFAVDGPDGTSDGQIKTNMKEVNSMIQFAAVHENADKVRQRHLVEDDMTRQRARDVEHDW